MRFTIRGKNIEVTEGLRSAVTEKLGKLEKYFTPETEIIVTLSVEKDRQKIEVTIPVKGNIIRSEQISNDMYVSIDLVEEVIERQLRKYKTKIIGKHKDGGNLRKEFIEKENEGEEEEVKIIRTKQFLFCFLIGFEFATEPSENIFLSGHFFTHIRSSTGLPEQVQSHSKFIAICKRLQFCTIF